MAENWAADVRKYDANADEDLIAAIVRYCGIALRNRDSSLVAFSDKDELARVRDNFLKKKLGLTASDKQLDAAIAAVGKKMKGDASKNRVTVYYLLLEQLGAQDKLPRAKAKAVKAPVAKAPAAKTVKAPAAKPAKPAAAKAEKPAAAKVAKAPPAAKPVKAEAPVKAAKPAAAKAAVAKPAKAPVAKPVVAKPVAAKAAKPAAAAGAGSLGLASLVTSASKTRAAKAADSKPVRATAAAASDTAPAAVETAEDVSVATADTAVGAAAAMTGEVASDIQSLAHQTAPASPDKDSGASLGWLWWLLFALLVAFLVWWLFLRG